MWRGGGTLKADYSEGVLTAESPEEAFGIMHQEGFKSLVAKIKGTYLPLHSLHHFTTGRRLKTNISFISSTPGFSTALHRVSRGYYLVLRKTGRAYTTRSLVSWMLASGLISIQVLISKLKPFRLPCLKCNSKVTTAYRAFNETNALVLPICHRGQVVNILTVPDLAHYALRVGRTEVLSGTVSVSKIAGQFLDVYTVKKLEPMESLRKYSIVYADFGDDVFLFDSSALQKFLSAYTGGSSLARSSG
jgi:hypothetical protein